MDKQDLKEVYSVYNQDAVIICILLNEHNSTLASIIVQDRQAYVLYYNLGNRSVISRKAHEITEQSRF